MSQGGLIDLKIAKAKKAQKIVCACFKQNTYCKIDASVHKRCGQYACSLELKDVRVDFEGAH